MAQPPIPDPASGSDPAMEDILASIRKILSEEEKGQKEDVLMLDPSMMVPESAAPQEMPPEPDAHAQPHAPETHVMSEPSPTPEPVAAPFAGSAPLVAPEAAAAAATSVGTLMRTLAAERNTAVSRGGPTIEDLVREELRPMLKAWLDAHLPPLVERLVRVEIERVVGRIAT